MRDKQLMDEEAMIVEAELRVKKGIEKGIEKGKEEANENTARKLFEMGMDIDLIMEATGLNEESIKNICQ